MNEPAVPGHPCRTRVVFDAHAPTGNFYDWDRLWALLAAQEPVWAPGHCRWRVGAALRRAYLCRVIDQFGQAIGVLVSQKRSLAATSQFFTRVCEHGPRPAEVTTDRAPTYLRVLDELLPGACHVVEQYTNNPIKADHGVLKFRLRPTRGFKHLSSAGVISTGHAFVQNLRRSHYELALDTDSQPPAPSSLR